MSKKKDAVGNAAMAFDPDAGHTTSARDEPEPVADSVLEVPLRLVEGYRHWIRRLTNASAAHLLPPGFRTVL